MYAIYAARLGNATASLPPEAAEVVRDSIGAAVQLAASCRKRTRSPWPPLKQMARSGDASRVLGPGY